MAGPEEVQALRVRLRDDWPFYAAHCLRIRDLDGNVIPFAPKPPQLKLFEAIRAQREQGEPQRAIILKSRKIGFSTMAQGLLIQRATQRPNHNAMVVAQDNTTAGELFEIGRFMWMCLPEDPVLNLKPPVVRERNALNGRRAIMWGEAATNLRHRGNLGINSKLEIDTAKEFEAGRGLTIHSLHASEVAFWQDSRKLLSLLNAVPDTPETLILVESTPNGLNHFKDMWDRAVAGESAYAPVFVAWWEEAGYERGFANMEEREAFADQVGSGPYGEDEPDLQDQLRGEGFDEATILRKLHWRRWTIANKTEGDVQKFHQEYASNPGEAFLSTGRQVFSLALVNRVIRGAEQTDPRFTSPDNPGPAIGGLDGVNVRAVRSRRNTVLEIPAEAVFKTRRSSRGSPAWRVWERPVIAGHDGARKTPPGQYVIGVDVMGGEDSDAEKAAWHAIEVIDHRTLVQCAEYRSRVDSDELAMQVYLACLFYNQAWVAVEVTGGWGMPVARRLAIDYHYPRVYTRRKLDERAEPVHDRLGWDTNRQTKPIMEDSAKELLREGTHGIRSRALAEEMLTYMKDRRGLHGPQKGKSSDLLMAWMIAQQVARERPLTPDRKKGPVQTSTHRMRSTVVGY